MPAPSRTSHDAIVAAARQILEEDGFDAVAMSRVAERVGIRGPSLYKHVRDRSALIRAIAEGVTADLAATLSAADATGDPRADLTAVAHAYRTFVRANPNGYGLLFANLAPDLQPDPAHLAQLALPLIEAMGTLVGSEDALSAARTMVSWAHGFVSMELAGALRLGGDLDVAYADGIESILDGVTGRGRPTSASRRTG